CGSERAHGHERGAGGSTPAPRFLLQGVPAAAASRSAPFFCRRALAAISRRSDPAVPLTAPFGSLTQSILESSCCGHSETVEIASCRKAAMSLIRSNASSGTSAREKRGNAGVPLNPCLSRLVVVGTGASRTLVAPRN